ncbi:unnamed protein product [Brugia pahangi]|uniref:Trehalase n=1 Tax=Brugia pahangi TaxID=6280 RepID=A0A0N4T8I1_BRUPA|nr:unnamed protein product [Brugia pahangi]
MIKLTVIKEEYHLKDGWFKNIIEYGKDEISLMKEKLNLIDENKLQMIPIMKRHIAAVDFIQTALLAFKALCKREIHGTCNMDMDTTNITTTSVIRDISDKKIGDIIHEKTIIGENVKGGNSSSDSSSDNGRKITIDPNSDKYIGIPSDEDVISNIIEIPEWACNEKHSTNYIIYCQGELLHAVMMLNIFKDSKTFVDKPLKRDPTEIASDFKKKSPRDITVNDREAIRQFIDENFDEEGHELEKYYFIFVFVKFQQVMKYPERHSLLYVPYEFIVPGGRFREFYYWDTYWVIKGLLASGMQETSRRIILNFEYLVKTIGFIPNGGRVYYLRRSQPPLFIPMVYEYYMATEDDDFLRSIMNTMEMEFNFWKTSRMINVTINERNHSVFYYRADSNVPR